MLSLPDLRQTTDWNCGPTSCFVVWSYFGMPRRQIHSSLIDGTDPRTLETALRVSGLPCLSGEMTIKDLAHFTKSRRPVIVLVRTRETPQTGHYCVVYGVQDRRVYIQCPSEGPISETVRTFEKRWHDIERSGNRLERWGIAVG